MEGAAAFERAKLWRHIILLAVLVVVVFLPFLSSTSSNWVGQILRGLGSILVKMGDQMVFAAGG